MKNIYVLPTNKPSRLHKYNFEGFALSKESLNWREAYNIYITSDEEIKEGDWYYLPRTNLVYKCKEAPTELNLERRLGVAKIILTTDQDLIKDGVQAIPDEFLEWFVKNPSCEEVVVHSQLNMNGANGLDRARFIYKIIIPKEEPKQERMYSEEDMAESFMACWKANVPEGFECKLSFKEWFEQFKKK